MNRRSKAILISGVIALLATIIITVLCIDNWSGLTGWAFIAMLWSVVVFFGGLIFVECISEKTVQIVTRSALYTVISAYSVINFCISFLFMILFKENNISFAVIQAVLLTVAAIIIIISLAASKGIQRINGKTMEAVSNIETMIERLNKLAIHPECEQFAAMLKKLSSDLYFTDISKSVPEDVEISNIISAIEIEVNDINEKKNDSIKANLVRLNTLISQRKNSVSVINKGKI